MIASYCKPKGLIALCKTTKSLRDMFADHRPLWQAHIQRLKWRPPRVLVECYPRRMLCSHILDRCVGCGKKGSTENKASQLASVPVCSSCGAYEGPFGSISATSAKKRFKVKDADLAQLNFHSSYNQYRMECRYYLVASVKAAAELAHGGADALAEKLKKSAARSAKLQATRAAKLAAEVVEQRRRRETLVAALEAAGLELRSDSWMCQQFIEGKTTDLEGVVATMKKMKILYSPPCNFGARWESLIQRMKDTCGREWLFQLTCGEPLGAVKDDYKERMWKDYLRGVDMTRYSF